MPFHYPQKFSVKISNCLGLQYPEKYLIFLSKRFSQNTLLIHTILYGKQTNKLVFYATESGDS